MTFTIKQAEPVNDRLLIAMIGPQGSGKTTSALRLATGIVNKTGGKICVIDTEKKRALKYAKSFNFFHIEFEPPFSPKRYDEAVQYAESQGFGAGDVIIIDSTSHEHDGPGGVLEIHDEYMKSKNYNQKFNMLGWNHAKKDRKRFIYFTLQRTPCHVILCFRAKEDLKEVKVNGKTQYINDGLVPVGADEYFYEMDISITLPKGAKGKPDWNQNSSRINEYSDDMPITKLLMNTEQISEETGARLAELTQVGNINDKKEKKPEESLEERTKRISKEIIMKIKSSKDISELLEVSNDCENIINEIKANSVAAHDYVMKEFEAKRLSFG